MASDTTPPHDQPHTILIAEDEHLLARDLAHELTEMGYTIMGPVANGEAAVELARKHRPDLALLDLRMPDMDGIEAGRILYDQFDIPVVVISAHSDREYIDACQAMGVFGYLLKPVESDELRIAIRIAWGRFKHQREQAQTIDQLERKIEERKIIEKAKGLLMARLKVTEPEAMKRLQKQARNIRRPMVDLARTIIESEKLME